MFVGSTQQAFMQTLGRQLRDSTAVTGGVTLVWLTGTSCPIVSSFRNGTPATTTMQWVPSQSENSSWTTTSATNTCTPHNGSQALDIANSVVFINSCTATPPPSNVVEVSGSIQGYLFAVPKASSQTAISYEQAYFVFGFGVAGMVTPWVDPTQMFILAVTAGTDLTIAANISVPDDVWYGKREGSLPAVVSALGSAANPEAAIGTIGTVNYDASRSTLTELAFRAHDQYAAYFTDSTSTSFDKQNIRDGHYTMWSPTFWMYYVNNVGQAVNANAKWVVDIITNQANINPTPDFDPIQASSTVGLVPDCAMRVRRSFDGGPLSLYKPAGSCTCDFLTYEPPNAVTCATCSASSPCATGVCREVVNGNGYCEEF
jgi:hypothetical protein